MKTQRTVSLASLGLCEYCNTLLTMEDIPPEAMDAEWKCPQCEGIITNKSFGYEEIEDNWQRTKWVDENGQWTETKPTNDFDLGDWHILVKLIASPY